MDGLFFYWVIWMAWVCIMFFVSKKVSYRFILLFHLLAVIVLSRYILTIYSFSIQLSGIYLFVIMCIMIRKYSFYKIVGVILNTFIVAMGYASFQFFVLLDPIWVMMEPSYLQCLFMNYLVLLLAKNWRMRLLVLQLGMITGDLVYGGVLTYQNLPYISLSFSWHDAITMVLIVQLLWSYLEFVTKWLYKQSQIRFFAKNRKNIRI